MSSIFIVKVKYPFNRVSRPIEANQVYVPRKMLVLHFTEKNINDLLKK